MNISSIVQNAAFRGGAGALLRKTGMDKAAAALGNPFAKQNGIVDALNKQKQSLQERKEALLASAAEKGLPQEGIQTQLDAYDEQLKKLDEQIAEASVQQAIAAPQPQKQAVSRFDSKPKTEQEIQNQRMNDLMSLSAGLDRVTLSSAAKTQAEGRGRVLESEIKQDGMNGASAESIARKEEELSALRQRAAGLEASLGAQLTDLNEQVQESAKPADEAETSEADTAPAAETASGGAADALDAQIERYVRAMQQTESGGASARLDISA